MSSRSAPLRATAVLAPGADRASDAPCDSIDRTRASRPDGRSLTASPTATDPEIAVPVTTVPVPATVNTRSTGRRNRSLASRPPRARATSARRARSSSMPRPVLADVTIGAPNGTLDCASHSVTSACTRSSHSGSAASALVSTAMPSGTRNCSSTSRCSRVCGMIPSSAATTSIATSMPDAPATMVRTRSSCPGTSTMPARIPGASSSGAKLRSIVMPRRRSSASRSIDRPVSAVTSADFP